MAKVEELQQIVGELMKIDSATVGEPMVLNGLLASSLGRARLDAALRSRLGVTNPGVYKVKTFGDLCRVLEVEGAADAATSVVRTRPLLPTVSAPGKGIALGVDIQSIADLPEEQDYWEGEFYQQHFTRQEIAYALLQLSPRDSFAAMWCAKEALRKADSRWAGVDWTSIEVVHDAAGIPSLMSGDQAIPCAVSLSHTGGLAVAVVGTAEPAVPVERAAPLTAVSRVASSDERSANKSRSALAIAIVALLVSLAAAFYVWVR